MIRRAPMGYIRRTSDPGSRSSGDTTFIQCVDSRGTQIHEVWSLSLDGIIRKVHPTERVEVLSGTVGEFMTDDSDENGHRI